MHSVCFEIKLAQFTRLEIFQLAVNIENSTKTLQTLSSNQTMQDPSNPIAPDVVSTTPVQVTSFVDDAPKVPASLPFIEESPLNLVGSGTELRDHTILDILNRPTKIWQGEWTSSQLFEELIVSLNFPRAIIDNSAIIAAKLLNFTYLRADVCIKVTVNAQPFQLGRLIGYFSPYSTEVGERATLNEFMSSYTAFPHAEISAAGGNTVSLKIPYVSPYSHYNLPLGIGDMGTFFLRVLNPLASSESSSADVTIFAWFENIDLSIPTPAPVSSPALSSRMHKLSKLITNMEFEHGIAQVGEEAEQSKSGIVETISGAVETLSEMASAVPLFEPVAIPAMWISRAINRVASFFGWDKPISVGQNTTMTQLPASRFTHASGLDNSVVLGTYPDNQIIPSHTFGSKVDEMDIKYVAQHMCYLDQFPWSTSDPENGVLYRIPVTPGVCQTRDENGTTVYKPTLLAFITSIFQNWKGSLKFRIQATKTAYHSGRLRIGFVPSGAGAVDANLDKGFNFIFDLRESEEISFEIPYISQTLWKEAKLSELQDFNNQLCSGYLEIQVLNKLVVSNVASNDIAINVWIGGGDSIDFSIPFSNQYRPNSSQPAFLTQDEVDRGVAQVKGDLQDPGFNNFVPVSSMFSTMDSDNLECEKLTIGENVSSLRSLIHRTTQIGRFNVSNSSALIVSPGYFGKTSFLDYISWIYRFWRGSTRYKLFEAQDGIDSHVMLALARFNVGPPEPPYELPITTVDPWRTHVPMHAQPSINNPFLEIQIPYYQNTPISIVGVENEQPKLSDHRVLFTNSSSNSVSCVLAESAGDDFSFGWLVGAPELVQNTEDDPTEISLGNINPQAIIEPPWTNNTDSTFVSTFANEFVCYSSFWINSLEQSVGTNLATMMDGTEKAFIEFDYIGTFPNTAALIRDYKCTAELTDGNENSLSLSTTSNVTQNTTAYGDMEYYYFEDNNGTTVPGEVEELASASLHLRDTVTLRYIVPDYGMDLPVGAHIELFTTGQTHSLTCQFASATPFLSIQGAEYRPGNDDKSSVVQSPGSSSLLIGNLNGDYTGSAKVLVFKPTVAGSILKRKTFSRLPVSSL